METYAKQSKPSTRTLSARAGHGRADVVEVLQAYRNRTVQLATLTDEEEQTLQGKFITQLQEDEEEMLQGKFAVQLQSDDEEAPLQGKFLTQLQSAEEEEPLQRKAENRTGLPDQLKSGVENLSGYSLDAVKVHYNSPRPAQLQALAYTQGTDIHVGPGQERYLGHEAWHVVQQMQGRVQPTTQLQGIAVNDNEGLEREADVMGEKIIQGKFIVYPLQRKANKGVIQYYLGTRRGADHFACDCSAVVHFKDGIKSKGHGGNNGTTGTNETVLGIFRDHGLKNLAAGRYKRDNPPGNCAEPHAVADALNNTRTKSKINSIQVEDAKNLDNTVRPRCRTCHEWVPKNQVISTYLQ